MIPKRIQLKRTKGWRMPRNTVKVDRTTIWGNPWKVTTRRTAEEAVLAFHLALFMELRDATLLPKFSKRVKSIAQRVYELRGKNLACWCKPGEPCHADVLLSISNEP